MNVYLVRKNWEEIVHVTMSRAHAISLAKIEVDKFVQQLETRAPYQTYETKLDHHAKGKKGKVYYTRIASRFSTGRSVVPSHWSYTEFWVQQHHLRVSALDLLAECAE